MTKTGNRIDLEEITRSEGDPFIRDKAIAEQGGAFNKVVDGTVINVIPRSNAFTFKYRANAHYRDTTDWENREKNLFKEQLAELLAQKGFPNGEYYFVTGPRGVYIDGVVMTTLRGNWFDQTSEDHGPICAGKCEGHDYSRKTQIYEMK